VADVRALRAAGAGIVTLPVDDLIELAEAYVHRLDVRRDEIAGARAAEGASETTKAFLNARLEVLNAERAEAVRHIQQARSMREAKCFAVPMRMLKASVRPSARRVRTTA
jgi:hypothetical protein